MGLPASKSFLTYEQFIEISESIRRNTGYITEYSNGEIYYFSPSAKYSVSINNIISILRSSLPKNCLPISEMHIRFDDNEYKIPDVSVFCGKDIKDKYENDLLHLEVPKMIFEVLSDSTERNDREYKMKLYAKAHIEEYILVDYRAKTLEQYYLNGDRYELNKKYQEDNICSLLLYPDVNFGVGDIFRVFIG
jgi:Uma2 family endonuclease